MIKIVDKITSRDVEGRYLIEILYEDNDIIVVNKPAGLLTIPDHWDKEKACLKEILESNLQKNEQTLSYNTAKYTNKYYRNHKCPITIRLSKR